MSDQGQTDIARAVQEVSERASLLIREEIELAKAEVTAKISKLAKGAAIGAAAGVFLLGALIYFLHAMSWLSWKLVRGDGTDNFYLGFLIVTVVLVILAAIAGFLAYRFVKGGAPPTKVVRAWGMDLATAVLCGDAPANDEWTTSASGIGGTPWSLQIRKSADGDAGSLFVTTLPSPAAEQLTGIIRSKRFSIPPALSFYLAGHVGFPGTNPPPRNFVRRLQPLGMLIEHRIDDVDEGLVGRKQAVTAREQISLQPSLAGMLAQDLHGAAVGR